MDIDALYTGFCSTLPEELRLVASELPCRLRLCPVRDMPWSIGANAVTLAAPALLAEALSGTDRAAVRQATLSHLLAVVHAFTVECVADGQMSSSPQLDRVSEELACARIVALAPLVGSQKADDLYAAAESSMRHALAESRELIGQGCPVGFERYLALSLAKQRVRPVASIVLAEADAGSQLAKVVQRLLAGISLGLQLEKDVVGWPDDFARSGGAWAISLARALRQAPPAHQRRTEPSSIVALVHDSGVLARMMNESERRLATAAELARMIGARRLGTWAEQRAARAIQLAGREEKTPGYTRRACSSAPCKAESDVVSTPCPKLSAFANEPASEDSR
jgi:diphthamide synthase (EF-2-diphthine--ammonia ligase)